MKGKVLYCLCNWILITATQIAIGDTFPTGCYQSNYTSNFTRCDLTFMFCYSRKVLQQCVMRKCQRFIRGAECYLETGFILQQPQCYQRCCGLSAFDEAACNKFNSDAAAANQRANTGLIVVMVLIAVALLAFAIWFSHKYLRCCDKTSPFMILKYNIKWKKSTYQQKKCEICRTYGPLMLIPCGHSFHISCFQQATKQMVCPKCQLVITDRIKIYCFHCRQKSFKVKLFRVQDIGEAISEGKALHYDECPKQIRTLRPTIQSQQRL